VSLFRDRERHFVTLPAVGGKRHRFEPSKNGQERELDSLAVHVFYRLLP
jgi:hypothetical protein